jgi:hypothetical protein
LAKKTVSAAVSVLRQTLFAPPVTVRTTAHGDIDTFFWVGKASRVLFAVSVKDLQRFAWWL